MSVILEETSGGGPTELLAERDLDIDLQRLALGPTPPSEEEEEDGDYHFQPQDVVSSSGSGGDPLSPTPSGTDDEEEEEEDLDFFDEDEEEDDSFEATLREIFDAKIKDTELFYDTVVIKPIINAEIGIQTEPTLKPQPQLSRAVEAKNKETQTERDAVSMSREHVDVARDEIGRLRKTKEVLNLERKGTADRIKAVKKSFGSRTNSSYSVRQEEKELIEFEEAIEAIDLAIEFKNELITGRETLLENYQAPGQEKAELVTRLTGLSMFDLQRLFCKFFLKVVELRFCTKKLEKNVDKLEDERDRMRRQMSIDRKAMHEKDKEHQERIMHLISQCTQNPGTAAKTHMIQTEQELSRAKRKLLDFQRSLTELLVRHGYLINGQDFDVKQVVKMLGLDPGDFLPAPTIPGSGPSSSKRTHDQRRNAEVLNHEANAFHRVSTRRPHQSQHSRSHHQSRTNYGHVPLEGYRDRDRGRKSQHQSHTAENNGQHSSRHQNHHPNSSHPRDEDQGHNNATEVKRKKNKLIIQPNSSH